MQSRASGLHRAGGQRPRETLQPSETRRDVYFQVHRRVFSSRNYPRQVTTPSFRFYGTADPSDERVAIPFPVAERGGGGGGGEGFSRKWEYGE